MVRQEGVTLQKERPKVSGAAGGQEKVDDLLLLARADPQEALRKASQFATDDSHSLTDRSVAFRAMSVAARHGETIDDSIRYARTSAELAAQAGDSDLRSAALGTLSGSMTIAGDATAALKVLAEATEGADGLLKAQLTFQRGAILENMGYGDEAMAAYTEALPIFRALGNQEFEALTLRNRGNVETSRGDLAQGEIDLLEARQINSNLALNSEVAGLDLNLGTLFSYKGDLPQALERFVAGDKGLMEIRGSSTPQHVGRCQALISAGLYNEAMELAAEIGAKNSNERDTQHASLAYLVAGRAAVLSGQPDRAVEFVENAQAPYRDRESEPWLLDAPLIAIRAQYRVDGPSFELAEDALELAVGFDERHSLVSGTEAHVLAGRSYLELGDLPQARKALADVSDSDKGPIEVRLQQHLARTLLSKGVGDQRAAAAAARSGLNLLETYQSAVGASDLRTGMESWGSELAAIGLSVATERKRPRQIWDWMERARARALIHPTVLPDEDEERAMDLVELRRLDAKARSDSTEQRTVLAKRRRVQERIKARDRAKRGQANARARLKPTALVQMLKGSELVELATLGDGIHRVHVKNGRFGYTANSKWAEGEAELRHFRFALRRAARRNEDQGLWDSLERLDRLLLGGIRFESELVVVIPPPQLMTVPWSLMPSLRNVDVVVSPSAELWYRSTAALPKPGRVLVAAGPDLVMAEREAADVASLYTDAQVLGPEQSTVENVLAALPSARIAHAATHAAFKADSPMFSSLRLADADLNVYDIERLGQAPSLVVLSACDSGFTETRQGEELTGLATALLRMGTKTVVASIGLVPDSESTRHLMVSFHQHLVAGHTPARALRLASEAVQDSPGGEIAAANFICIGTG